MKLDSYIQWIWKHPSNWKYVRYDSFHFVLVFVYIVVMVVGTFMFAKYHYHSKIFKIMMLLGIAVRFIFFAMQPFIIEDILMISNSINVALNALPSFFFFSAYIMILFFWMQIYKTNQPHKIKTIDRRVLLFLIISNSIMYGTVIILISLDFVFGGGLNVSDHSGVPSATNKYETGLFSLAAVLYITVSIGFFFYGYYAFRYVYYENMEVSLQRLEQRKKLLRKVALITLVCMSCFVLRAGITLLALFYAKLDAGWWLDGIYYIGLEVIPIIMMLRAYYPPKSKGIGVTSPLIRSS